MQRIALTDEFGNPTGTWFDADRAIRYAEDEDWDGSNFISRATGSQWNHEALYRTASGRWILNGWSAYQGSTETYYEISPSRAEDWLIANDHADALPEEVIDAHEVGAGKTPQRSIRLTDDLWMAAQERARQEGTDTSGLIRRLLTDYLADSPLSR